MDIEANTESLILLTSDIVAAHVSNNQVEVGDLPQLISSIYGALSSLGAKVKEEPARPEPAVSVRASVKPDYIVCLEDGKKLKMLKRHLMTHYNMTPEDYRARWDLPADYPMVAPDYAEKRRALARKIGLGRKPAVAAPAPAKAKATRNGDAKATASAANDQVAPAKKTTTPRGKAAPEKAATKTTAAAKPSTARTVRKRAAPDAADGKDN